MGSESVVLWSDEKRKHLYEQLVGMWAEDIWVLTPKNQKRPQQWHFTLTSVPLKIEIKYALWQKFEQGQWKQDAHMHCVCQSLALLVQWFNQMPFPVQSLLEKPLEQWEIGLRSYLVQVGQYKQRRQKKLLVTQTYHETVGEDTRIRLFRQIYAIIRNAYDDRREIDKDIWDLRTLGVPLNLTYARYKLNFTGISQLWLRQLTKDFMQYNIAVRSAADCFSKIDAIHVFSSFLTQRASSLQARNIDRAVITSFINYLQETGVTEHGRRTILIHLRTFLEVCAHQLCIQEITRELLILDNDLPRESQPLPRDIPEEVLIQLREHLPTLDTTRLRMVTILLECGMRISELCTLPLDCLLCDDKHEWYLRSYQSKLHQEHVIPLVDDTVVGIIQAQQEETRAHWGETCPYLFPRPKSRTPLPFMQDSFREALNRWAVEKKIQDRNEKLWRFQSHQFRHTVGMRLINEDVPLEVIRRLFGHHSLGMTARYAQIKETKLRQALERVARSRKTVDYQGQLVKGDASANGTEAQMIRKGIRGQTLPVGGCGRLVVRGPCDHANKCITCPFWLTSTDDVPALKSFYERAIRLRQRALQVGNQVVIIQQDHIVSYLAVRIKSLEDPTMDGTLCVDDLLAQLYMDLAEAESGLDETREAGLVLATKHLERTIIELQAKIESLKGAR
ncbi:tyrosine-type recombinase/integrase [Ktedonobacteria bacterium brp13]|nr:tyrosine-type recombinase/integrase [Ktedonobacteria bacterium brp13]